MENGLKPLKRVGLGFIAVISILVVLPLLSCTQKSDSANMETINFGTVPTAASALIYIAQDRQFFEDNGLRVTIKDYNSGIATTEALATGGTDISWVAEFPFVRRAFEKDELSLIAVVSRFNEQNLFGLKSRGINTVGDLKGKKIGIPRNTIAEFYLGRFLELNGISTRDVSIVDVQPSQALDTISGGSIDAVVAWQPYSSQLRAQLADKAVAFQIQINQPGYGALAIRNDWISGRSETINRFLKSLVAAENYLNRNIDAAKEIVRKRLNYNDAFTESIWSENKFSLSLDQSLILAMEDEARWMISNNLTTEKVVPNFLDYIYTEGLKSVKPGAVQISGKMD